LTSGYRRRVMLISCPLKRKRNTHDLTGTLDRSTRPAVDYEIEPPAPFDRKPSPVPIGVECLDGIDGHLHLFPPCEGAALSMGVSFLEPSAGSGKVRGMIRKATNISRFCSESSEVSGYRQAPFYRRVGTAKPSCVALSS